MTNSPNMYYFVDDATLTVIVTSNLEDGSGFVYVGTSDNPKPKMAIGAFTQQGRIKSGYTLRILG